MKKYLNINTFCIAASVLATIVALWTMNISAFLGWFWATIYIVKDVYRKDCL